jgi:hypothetical protein
VKRYRGSGKGKKVDMDVLIRNLEKLDSRAYPTLSKFDFNGSLGLRSYLRKFERYCENTFRGDKSLWTDELERLLEGETLMALRNFKELGVGYREVKQKLLCWYEDTKDIRKEKNRMKLRQVKLEHEESIFLFSSRLEGMYRAAYPKHEVNMSKILREIFASSLPRDARLAWSSQVMASRMNGSKVTWNSVQKFARAYDKELEYRSRRKESGSNEIFIQVGKTDPRSSRGIASGVRQNCNSVKGRSHLDEPKVLGRCAGFQDAKYIENLQYRSHGEMSEHARKSMVPDASQFEKPVCRYCNRPGHIIRDCRSRLKACYACGDTGHFFRDCSRRIGIRRSQIDHDSTKVNDRHWRGYPGDSIMREVVNYSERRFGGGNLKEGNSRDRNYQSRVDNQKGNLN